MSGPLSFYNGLIDRLDGPLHFRFFAQPAMAAFLAIRDGVKDAREDKAAYFWAILSGVASRVYLLRSGLKSVGKVIVPPPPLSRFCVWPVLFAMTSEKVP